MKKSSDYINEKVFKLNQKYARLQNQTEELFFKCLNEGRSVDYFKKKLDKIWGNIDHSYLENEIDEYIYLIYLNNIEQLNVQEEEKQAKKGMKTSSKLMLIALILASEKKFKKYIEKRYEKYRNSYGYSLNKDEYLKRKVKDYDNQVIPYFDKYGEVVRYVQLSTYLSMRYNTALTRAGWERTMEDAEYLGYNWFYIPPHLFSCEHCSEYQGRMLSVYEVNEFMDKADEQEGNILHPNCKCELLIYTPLTQIVNQKFTKEEIEEYYEIRQKVNSLTLKKERILTDIRVQKSLGNQDEVDKLNNQRKVINSQIRDLIDELPTAEMKTKVVAINR